MKNKLPFDIDNLKQMKIPQNQIDYFEKLNSVAEKAINNPNQLKRIFAGMYYVFNNNELIEIEQLNEGAAKNLWIAREVNGTSFSDPYDTLNELKYRMGL